MLFMTSDEHYGHRNIIQFCARPFVDVPTMNEGLIAAHNATVCQDDDVWHLGDFAMTRSVAAVATILSRLNGRHHLVMGNHDVCHPCHGGSAEHRRDQYLAAGFVQVVERAWLDLPAPLGRTMLCHMPSVSTQFDERYSEYRPKPEELTGMWLIHGHVHTQWRVRNQEKLINVGVDVWNYRPVSIDQIVAAASGPA